jgi:hypothetical protein
MSDPLENGPACSLSHKEREFRVSLPPVPQCRARSTQPATD